MKSNNEKWVDEYYIEIITNREHRLVPVNKLRYFDFQLRLVLGRNIYEGINKIKA